MTRNLCNHHGKAQLRRPPPPSLPPLRDPSTSPQSAHTKPPSNPLLWITSPSPSPRRAECGPLSRLRTSVPGKLSHLIIVGGLCAARDTGPFVWELCGDTGRRAVSNISHVRFPRSVRSPSGADVHLGLTPTPAAMPKPERADGEQPGSSLATQERRTAYRTQRILLLAKDGARV